MFELPLPLPNITKTTDTVRGVVGTVLDPSAKSPPTTDAPALPAPTVVIVNNSPVPTQTPGPPPPPATPNPISTSSEQPRPDSITPIPQAPSATSAIPVPVGAPIPTVLMLNNTTNPVPQTPTPSQNQTKEAAVEDIPPIQIISTTNGTQTLLATSVLGFCIIVIAVLLLIRRRQQRRNHSEKSVGSPTPTLDAITSRCANGSLSEFTVYPDNLENPHAAPSIALACASSRLSEDPDIVAMRIPMDTLQIGDLISYGSFGEVYRGFYRAQPVAIKRLLPERRKNLAQIDVFLAEAKMMGALEHERIVRFIGVAWDSLSEVSVVSEFMDGGDLRSLLMRFETVEHRPHGFDHDKTKIALHVAHALMFLHSLDPVVLHRDLKSKNILMNANYDAKLADFGVARESTDAATMTAGVGSSMWMAPEVVMGERYDEKADVFSFGVVLSELDTQQTPYMHATEPETGRRMPEPAILQLVSTGRLMVHFSEHADDDLVALGRACVSLDPTTRPTASEILHRIDRVWRGGVLVL